MRTAAAAVRIMASMAGPRLDDDPLSQTRVAEADELQSGSRVARLRASHSYGLVLLLVLSSIVFTALIADDAWVQSVLVVVLAAVLVLALWTSGVARLRSHRVVLLLAFAAAVALSPVVTGGRALDGALALIDAALVAGALVAIGRGAIDQGEVNQQSLLAAICVYLLVGMFFVFVYGAVAALDSGAFFAQGTDGTTAERLYFSYVTLATLGYGDYTADSNLGHLLSISEALLGQLYLVTVLALLVSALGRKRSEASGD